MQPLSTCQIMSVLDSVPCIYNVCEHGDWGCSCPTTLLRLTGDYSRWSLLPWNPTPRYIPPWLDHLPGGQRWLNQTQNACHPPVARHDDPAGHPAASVVVRPRVVPSQRFADPLAVGVAATALVAAHTLVVQHGVDLHGALFTLETSLRGDRVDSGSEINTLLVQILLCDSVRLERRSVLVSSQLKMDFRQAGWGGGDVVRCGFLLSNIFFCNGVLAVYPCLWLSGVCSGLGDA